jgi:hypothetical protein
MKQRIRRELLRLLPRHTSETLLGLKHRHTWRRDRRSHVAYHHEYETRGALIDEVQRWMTDSDRARVRVLEFGCSGANNLRLMRERQLGDIDYCGLDINAHAIDFARRNHPGAHFHVCDDVGFEALAPQLGRFDAFLAFAVLYYIPPARVLRLLRSAAGMADRIFICDDLSRFDAAAGDNDGLFLHPWASLCREAGLEVVHGPTPAADANNRHGLFVAQPLPRRA